MNWFNPLDQIQTFSFADGTTINVAGMSFQTGGAGTNTLVGTAASNWLAAGAGGGTLTGGGGADVLIGGAAATTLIGGGGNDLLYGGSAATTVDYLGATGAVAVNLATGTASQNGYGGTDTLVGIHSVLAGSNGILTAGAGNDTLSVTGSNDTLTGGSGTSTLVDSGTEGFFDFNAGAGQVKIVSGASANSSASNELDFGTGISDNQLWFLQSGNDLQIDLMGTTEGVPISNWFGSTGNQLQEITAGGQKLDSQVSQLVQAMATYSANHAGFDPTIATQAPSDPTLQTAIASSWHA